MSDVARYRKAYPRLFRHPGFTELSPIGRLLTLYLLHGPQSNRLGLFFFSVHTAADDLDASAETLKKGLADVCTTFGWHFDAVAKVFYIPTWWKWNPPENINVLKGALKDLAEIPPCGLVDAFAANVDHLPNVPGRDGVDVRQTFAEGLAQRLPKPSRTQEQYQEPFSIRKQEPRASRGKQLGDGFDVRANYERLRPVVSKLPREIDDEELLLDHFRCEAGMQNVRDYTRDQAVSAIRYHRQQRGVS